MDWMLPSCLQQLSHTQGCERSLLKTPSRAPWLDFA